MKLSLKVLGVTTLFSAAILSSQLAFGAAADVTATWTGLFNDTNQNWTDGANWDSTPDYPSAEGAGAIFVLDGTTPDNLRVNVTPAPGTEPAVTVGSILFDNTSNKQVTLTGGTTIAMRFNADGDGPATVTVQGNATGTAAPNQMNARSIFDDSVVAIVNPNSNTSVSGDLDWTGAVASGAGGFTKQGLGLLTLGSNVKAYTGPTIFDTDSGRTRISFAGRPSATSSMTFKAGSQLELITNNSTYTFGASSSVPLNLNGAGPTSGEHAPFPGVIRNSTNVTTTITNNVELQSTSTIHVQGSLTGSTTLSGSVGGVGGLIAGANPHNADLGSLQLTGSNSYSGGTTARAGNLIAAGASVNAFGTGNVAVESANLVFTGSAAKLTIATGATDAINDLATLSLAGGNTVGVADDGFADLGAGINEIIGGLILGGSVQTLAGTYGSVASGATHQFDEYFAGLGLITLVPGAGQPGDHNEDGKVDAADYVAWRKLPGNFGGTPGGYDEWRENFGEPAPGGGGSGAVPEPASALLTFFALTGLMAVGRRSIR